MSTQLTPSGVFHPEKYPQGSVGSYYQHYGEQPGYVYLPWKDRYVPDPKAQKDYLEESGLSEKPKSGPGTGTQLGIAAGGAVATGAGAYIGKGALDGSLFSSTPSTSTPSTNANVGLLSGAQTAPTGAPISGAGASTPSPGYSYDFSKADLSQSANAGQTSGGLGQPTQGGTPVSGGVSYGQAAGGGLQVLQGVNQYQQGNYTGGTINTAAGAGNIAASGAVGTGAQAGATSALGGYLVPGLNLAAGVYGGYQTAKYTGSAPAGGKRNTMSTASGAAAGAATGAAVGSVVPVLGTAVGAVVGGIVGAAAGAAGSWLGSSKDQYQMLRDSGRKFLKQKNILDDKYQGTLADGSKFDFGKDGKGQTEIDYNDPVTGEVIAKANLLAAGEGWTGKAREGMAKLYTAAAMSNSGGDLNKAFANMKHFYTQRGFNQTDVQAELDKQFKEKKMTEEKYKVFSATNAQFTPAAQNVGLLANAQGSPGMRPGKSWNGNKYVDNKPRQQPKQTKTDKVFNQVGAI